MPACTTCPHKAPQGLSEGPSPFFPRRCGLAKMWGLFTRTFIHPNLELKKVPALNALRKIFTQYPTTNKPKKTTSNWPTHPTPMFAIRSCSTSSQAHNLHWNEISQEFVCTNTSDALTGEFGYSSVLFLAGMPKLVGTSTDCQLSSCPGMAGGRTRSAWTTRKAALSIYFTGSSPSESYFFMTPYPYRGTFPHSQWE